MADSSSSSSFKDPAITPGIKYSIYVVVSYSKLSPKQRAFSIAPSLYHQAVKHAHWRAAMSAELFSLQSNNT